MNWKAEAMEKLRNYDALRQSTLNIPEEISQLEQQAVSIRGARTDSTPVKGSGNKREEALLNNITERQELSWALDSAISRVKVVERALSALQPDEKLVLHRMYICPERGAVERLCAELGLEQSSIYRKRDRALRKFTMALYGCTESV